MSDQVTLVTPTRQCYIASKTNVTTQVVGVLATKYATATKPVTGTNNIIVGAPLNYLKVSPWFVNAATSATHSVRVIGWSFCKDVELWMPHALARVACTLNTSATATLNGTAAMCASSSLVNSEGDAKLMISAAGSTNGFFVVDTMGFELIELHFTTTVATAVCNAHLSEI